MAPPRPIGCTGRRQTGAFEIIGVINDGKTVSYRDDKIQLGVTYRYQVGGVSAQNVEVKSNVEMITTGVYIAVNSQVAAMVVDPKRPFLYGVDSVNNQLHVVSLTDNTLAKSIFVGSKPSDLDINVAGTELFIANFGATEIAVVNLETREKARTLTVNTMVGTWDGNPFRLACTAGDTVVFTSEDQWNDLKLVDAKTGANLAGWRLLYQPELVASPDGTRLYVGETGISRSTLTRFDVNGSSLTMTDVSGDIRRLRRRALAITRDGKYLFYAGKKLLATNLKSVLGTFTEPIYLSNGDGSMVMGSKSIHDGNTFAILRPLPLSTAIMAISPDDKTLYLYDQCRAGSTSTG
jgi:DNA-binding beta-propeller fold protein YncE